MVENNILENGFSGALQGLEGLAIQLSDRVYEMKILQEHIFAAQMVFLYGDHVLYEQVRINAQQDLQKIQNPDLHKDLVGKYQDFFQ